jgi:hypothetical protein
MRLQAIVVAIWLPRFEALELGLFAAALNRPEIRNQIEPADRRASQVR